MVGEDRHYRFVSSSLRRKLNDEMAKLAASARPLRHAYKRSSIYINIYTNARVSLCISVCCMCTHVYICVHTYVYLRRFALSYIRTLSSFIFSDCLLLLLLCYHYYRCCRFVIRCLAIYLPLPRGCCALSYQLCLGYVIRVILYIHIPTYSDRRVTATRRSFVFEH